MDDAMVALSVVDNAIQCGFMKDKHSLLMIEWAKEYRDDIQRCKMFLEHAKEKHD